MSAADCPPWLSVIMPTYRGERWIDATLSSLLGEADAGVEILVIDSSPSPETLRIAETYADRLRMRFFTRPDLPMWPAKTNFGARIAEARHICSLQQDDLWLPGRAACIRAWIDEAPDAALHLAPTTIIDTEGRRLGIWQCPLPANRELDSDMVVERLLVQNFIAAPTPVIRRDAWLAMGGFDEALWYCADWDGWLKLAATGPVRYHESITTAFRVHETSLSASGSRNLEEVRRQMQIVLDRHLPRLGDRSRRIEEVARASISVNAALASAASGDLRFLPQAASQILWLGPAGIGRYLRDSRIVDRVMPRLRAKMAGAL